MRCLLNTLYVTTEDAYLSLNGENIVVLRGDEELGRFPLHTLEGILCFSYRGASPALMGACSQRNIDLCFLLPNGKFLARICGETRGNVLLRKTQYKLADDADASLLIAKNMIFGKLYNSRWVLERATRDHVLSLDTNRIKTASFKIKDSAAKVLLVESADSLRGVEGDAAADYFSVFDELILRNEESFRFRGRSKRPPLDNVNAMLSFAYSLLANNCAAALESVGLDPYVGIMHTIRPGRASMALDLMEELRSVMADRFVLYCLNNRIMTEKMFDRSGSGAVYMNDSGRKVFLRVWQERKTESLTHPFLNEKIKWGLVPYLQALLLARYLRGDLDTYPPFLWK